MGRVLFPRISQTAFEQPFLFFFLHSSLLLGVCVYSATQPLCTCYQWQAGMTCSFRDEMSSNLNHGSCASFKRSPSTLYMEFLWHLETPWTWILVFALMCHCPLTNVFISYSWKCNRSSKCIRITSTVATRIALS